MTNLDVLIKYCECELLHQEGFTTYMEQYHNLVFTRLNQRLLNNTQISIVNRQKKLVEAQKLKTMLYENEIKIFLSSGIPFVGIKGFFIQKFYYPDDVIRLYSDIDIQVADNCGRAFYRMLKENGYKVIKGLSEPLNYQKKLLIDKVLLLFGSTFFKLRHHAELEKEVSTSSLRIVLDLHGNLFLSSKSPKNRMIKDAISKEMNGPPVKIFSPEDNLVFLMYHAIKHIGYVNLAREYLGVNLMYFYDVAQIIDQEKINWELFSNRVTEHSFFIPAVSLFLKMFCDIYPDKIPMEIVGKFKDLSFKNNFHWKEIYIKSMGLMASDLIIGNYKKIPDLHNHCEYVSRKHINREYVWIFWSIYYLKQKIKKVFKRND